MDKYDLETYNTIRALGIPAHVKGYEYIKSAARYLRSHPQAIHRITTELYVEVAKEHNITPSRIERGIRHAISISRADHETWMRVLGRSIKITNSEFLATLNEVAREKLALAEEMMVSK